MTQLSERIDEIKYLIELWSRNKTNQIYSFISDELEVDKIEIKQFIKSNDELQSFVRSFFDVEEYDRRDVENIAKIEPLVLQAINEGRRLALRDITKETGAPKTEVRKFAEANPQLWMQLGTGKPLKHKNPSLKINPNQYPLTDEEKKAIADKVEKFLNSLESSNQNTLTTIAKGVDTTKNRTKEAILSDPYLKGLFALKSKLQPKSKIPTELEWTRDRLADIAKQSIHFLDNLRGPSGSLSYKTIAKALGVSRTVIKTATTIFPEVAIKFKERTEVASKVYSQPAPSKILYTPTQVNLLRENIIRRSVGMTKIEKLHFKHKLALSLDAINQIFENHPELEELLEAANIKIEHKNCLDFGSFAVCELAYYKGRLTKRITLILSKKDLEEIGCEHSILYWTDKDKNVGIYPPPTPDIGLYPVASSAVCELFTVSWSPSFCKEPTIGKRVPIHLHTVVTEHRNGLWFTFPEQFFLDRFK